VGHESTIEWTDATWPVVKGCDYVSPGCANCYAATLIHRHSKNPNPKISLPIAGLTNERGRWTGKVYLNEPHLTDPLKWKRGRMIFVPSHGDLFHTDVPDWFIDRVFAVMALSPRHTFQVLTKRPERMREYLAGLQSAADAHAPNTVSGRFTPTQVINLRMFAARPHVAGGFLGTAISASTSWPLPNVWIGVSVENQATADERIPHLLATPAAVRFLSCEPLLSAVDLTRLVYRGDRFNPLDTCNDMAAPHIDWCIVGGESGPGARPMNIEWARSLVGQCRAAGVACFVKQDSGPRPGMKGQIPDDIWVKEFPDAK
jgi:protein gp37